jgi:SHS2 domain-containing protein
MYRFVEHTGELELELEAATEAGVFAAAAAALRELLAGEDEHGPVERHTVALSAPDRAALLADWLSELVFLAETEGFVPERVPELALSETALTATVEGRRGSPPHLVKAVTYHELQLAPTNGGWRGKIVLDV